MISSLQDGPTRLDVKSLQRQSARVGSGTRAATPPTPMPPAPGSPATHCFFDMLSDALRGAGGDPGFAPMKALSVGLPGGDSADADSGDASTSPAGYGGGDWDGGD